MKSSPAETPVQPRSLSNGPVAAAVVAAGVGSFAVGLLGVIADVSPVFRKLMIFYRPTGPLSGVTTCALSVWVVAWFLLDRRWKNASVRLGRTNVLAFVLLGLGLLLTFPPFAALF